MDRYKYQEKLQKRLTDLYRKAEQIKTDNPNIDQVQTYQMGYQIAIEDAINQSLKILNDNLG